MRSIIADSKNHFEASIKRFCTLNLERVKWIHPEGAKHTNTEFEIWLKRKDITYEIKNFSSPERN